MTEDNFTMTLKVPGEVYDENPDAWALTISGFLNSLADTPGLEVTLTSGAFSETWTTEITEDE